MERSLNDALNIAQISQSLLQKAMTVSSRLRNIAEQTIVTGRTDHDELRSTIADIQASMQHYGEVVAPPPVSVTGGGQIPPMPQVMRDVRQVVAAVDQLGTGTVPDAGAMDGLNASLQSQSVEAGHAVADIQGRLQGVVGSYPLPADFNAASAVPATSDLIVMNPAPALGVQGNLNRDAVVRVLGA
jgi:hypothetical protein